MMSRSQPFRPHAAAGLRRVSYAAAGFLMFGLYLASALSTAHAQQSTTASLSGRISDPNGAVVSGAQVTATFKATGVRRETTTNEDGFYTLS
ncbi:MAG TPA: carboxypeptidase-like regulatory domain-containing protein, partial [Pyrinomonadaceae bacterium]|nr:carboxypeptidase-like regulatory domain-containing protein [Pyrinomonadaceae bacterium]